MKKLLIVLLSLLLVGLVGCKKMSVDEINDKLSSENGQVADDTKEKKEEYTVEIIKGEYTTDTAYKIEGKVTANTKNSGFTSIEIELLNEAKEVVDTARINVGAIKVGETKEFSGSAVGSGIVSYGKIKVTGY